jgi:hypothetical protein
MMLYRIAARQLVPVRQLSSAELASLGADHDAWLAAHGYGPEFTLRAGIVQQVTARESRRMAQELAGLKRRGLCPSAATAILGKLASEKGAPMP